MAEEKPKPFWQSHKFYYTLATYIVFTVIVFSEKVEFTDWTVVVFLLGTLGVPVAGHTASDVAGQIGRAMERRGHVTSNKSAAGTVAAAPE